MSTETKKQHYVPQFLLKSWAKGKANKINIFDKKEVRQFCSSVRDTAHENNFYNEELFGYGNKTEAKLASLETETAPIIKKILAHGEISVISEYEKQLLSLFTAVQMLRTNHIREFLSSFQDILAKKLSDIGVSSETEVENFSYLDKNEQKSSSINILNTLPGEIIENLINKRLILMESPPNISFYTSDNPIVKNNNVQIPGRGNLGIAQYGIEIYFPLSPRYCLNFVCDDYANDICKKYLNIKAQQTLSTSPTETNLDEAGKLFESFNSQKTLPLNYENVVFNNSQQVIQSTRFVYSETKDFGLAFEMLENNPEIRTQPKVVDGSQVF